MAVLGEKPMAIDTAPSEHASTQPAVSTANNESASAGQSPSHPIRPDLITHRPLTIRPLQCAHSQPHRGGIMTHNNSGAALSDL